MCADFEMGATRTKMRGGLRFPVTITVKDGDDVIARGTAYGLRAPKERTRILLPDDDVELEVEWAQCENERAPAAVSSTSSKAQPRDAASWECGKATPYNTAKVVVKKGDAASRTLTFPPPPNAACWTSDIAQPEGDAGAPEPKVDVPDAGAAVEVDAGADAGGADAGAEAGTAPADAGATKKAKAKAKSGG